MLIDWWVSEPHRLIEKLRTSVSGNIQHVYFSSPISPSANHLRQPTTSHHTTLQYTTQHNTTLHNTTLHNTTSNHTAPHHTTLHNTTPHYTTLHHITPHHTTTTISPPQLCPCRSVYHINRMTPHIPGPMRQRDNLATPILFHPLIIREAYKPEFLPAYYG